MIRLLVTRALPEALETVAEIEAQGAKALLAPVRRAMPMPVLWPETLPDALAVTSTNALRHTKPPEAWYAIPLLAVGEHTAEAARALGFAQVSAAGGDQLSLCEILRHHIAPPAVIGYLTGEPHRPELEAMLRAGGYAVQTLSSYRMVAMDALPEVAIAALSDNSVDAILHFSAENAETFAALADSAGLCAEAFALPQACLSAAIAKRVLALAEARGQHPEIAIAPERRGSSLVLAALAHVRRKARPISD